MPTTLNKVLTDMRKFESSSGKRRSVTDYPDIDIKFLEAKVYPKNKQVTFRTQVQSQSGPHRYAPHVQFSNMKISEEHEDGMVPVQDESGKQYYMNKADFNSSVNLKCTCSDFRHTWETELAKNGGLIGRPRKYTRKTDTYPERNPKHVMGMCKHVYSVIRQLATVGVLDTNF